MINQRLPDPTPINPTCPNCGSATATVDDAHPWCPGCEWNLDRHKPHRHPAELGWRWVDRRTRAIANRLTRRQFAELVDHPLDRSPRSLARVVITGMSALLLAGALAIAVTEVWLIVAHPALSLATLLGGVLIALAVALRPRFGKLAPRLMCSPPTPPRPCSR